MRKIIFTLDRPEQDVSPKYVHACWCAHLSTAPAVAVCVCVYTLCLHRQFAVQYVLCETSLHVFCTGYV